jgi:hypothetical protein
MKQRRTTAAFAEMAHTMGRTASETVADGAVPELFDG